MVSRGSQVAAARSCIVLAMLEGGYDLHGLAGGVEAFVRPLI